jgi:hypothetical protein
MTFVTGAAFFCRCHPAYALLAGESLPCLLVPVTRVIAARSTPRKLAWHPLGLEGRGPGMRNRTRWFC